MGKLHDDERYLGFKAKDDNWKSAETLVHNIVDVAAKGGNYLLNIGPTPGGKIPAPSVERLAEVGDWMNVNSEAIYATNRLNKFKEGENLYYTKSKDESTIYTIVTAWPGNELRFQQVTPEEGSEIMLLGYEQPLEWSKDGAATVVKLPKDLQTEANRPTKYAWTFKLKGQETAMQ